MINKLHSVKITVPKIDIFFIISEILKSKVFESGTLE